MARTNRRAAPCCPKRKYDAWSAAAFAPLPSTSLHGFTAAMRETNRRRSLWALQERLLGRVPQPSRNLKRVERRRSVRTPASPRMETGKREVQETEGGRFSCSRRGKAVDIGACSARRSAESVARQGRSRRKPGSVMCATDRASNETRHSPQHRKTYRPCTTRQRASGSSRRCERWPRARRRGMCPACRAKGVRDANGREHGARPPTQLTAPPGCDPGGQVG
jgi:hypothetical protein